MAESRQTRKFLSLGFRPVGLLIAGGAVLCAATGLGFLGRYAWFLDLFSHFRVQYGVSLLILAPLALLFKQRRTAGVFSLFALLNILVILPMYVGSVPENDGDEHTVRAMLINVNTCGGDARLVAKALQSIDHCLYSEGIRIQNREIGPLVGSDHFPVIVDFVLE